MHKILPLATLAIALVFSGNAALAQMADSGMQGQRAGVAATAHPGSSASLAVLYDQTANATGGGAMAMNFLDPGFDQYDTEPADDFTVPAGQFWLVQAVDVTSSWVPGIRPGPQATDLAMNVTFYRGARPGALPGAAIARFTNIPVDVWSGPNVAIALPSPVRLRAGTYWVSVQLNVTYLDIFGYWLWNTRSSQSGGPAAWRNPGGGWDANCTRWSHSADCLYGSGPGDHVFVLRGRAL